MEGLIEVPVPEYISLLKSKHSRCLEEKDAMTDKTMAKSVEWQTKYYELLKKVPTCPCNELASGVIEFSGVPGKQQGCCVQCGKEYNVVETTESEG